MKRIWAVGLSFVLVGALAPVTTATPACASEEIALDAYSIKAKAREKVYRTGETALIDVRVRDKNLDEPAGDVDVGLGFASNGSYLYGFDRTNAKGRVTVEVQLPRYLKPGWVNLDAIAYKREADTPCLSVTRRGYEQVDKAFRIKRAN